MDRVTVKQALNGFRPADKTKRARFYSNSNLPKVLAKRSEASGAVVYELDKHRRWCLRQLSLLALPLLQLLFASGIGAQVQVPAGRGVVRLEATQQRKEGDRYIADGDVDVRYLDMRLRADHIEYDSKTYETLARGHVIFDYNTQHIEGNEGHYNVRSDRGVFLHVHGTITVARRPNPNVLFSTNPIYFEADEVDRLSDQTYLFKKTWLTICLPNRPIWKFYAAHATLKVNQKVVLVRANFRLLKVPLIYLPYASIPASQRVRQSGFMMPEFSENSTNGFVFGDSYYWAATDWMDAEGGVQFLSKRGWSQSLDLRAVPWNNVNLGLHYFGVEDRGLPGANGALISEGGNEAHLLLTANLTRGWRAVADLNYLNSLTFRLAFATTFNEATVSEQHSDAFLTNNFRGFSLNIAALNYKDFLTAQPETSIVLRSAPEVRFSSTDRPFWHRWPVYFGFDSVSGAVRRSDTTIDTGQFVERSELAPHVVVPLRWGPWFGITSTAGFRGTHYGEQLANGTPVGQGLIRTDGEFSVELHPPSFERIWDRGKTKWKHVLEPKITYNYVTGIQDFSRIIRFDQDDTITDTSEIESSVTQRLFRKTGDGQAEEFLTWRLATKYYLDPTFGGALVPGQRNVFAALDSITPFAFADQPRRWSPIVSDVKMNYTARYDIQLETDYDSSTDKLAVLGLIATMRPYQQSFISLAQFRINSDPILQPLQNQIRLTAGWGQMNRKGWNTATSFAYDTLQHELQYEVVQASYNGSCCGISFEYRRLALGPLRNDNQFRAALLIANIGTFGTLRRQERVF
jgi:LPS-assembly protein